jgi:DNA polymerase-1
MSYSLDSLAERYLGQKKSNDELIQAIKEYDIYPYRKYELKEVERARKKEYLYLRDWDRHKDSDILRWAKENMDVLQKASTSIVSRYANKDTSLCYQLFCFYKTNMSDKQLELSHKYSMLAHICIDYRLRGVPIDLKKLREAQEKIGPLTEQKKSVCYLVAGKEFNIHSSQETGNMLILRGLGVPPQIDENGNLRQREASDGFLETCLSVQAKWLKQQDDALCKNILDFRQYIKIKKDVFDRLLEIQAYTIGPDAYKGDVGVIYPELNLMRAKTGRFSSQGPNIQNQPVRHPVLGKMVRELFIPHKGETWYSLDYSNQEGRLQVHFAALLECRGAEEMVKQFQRDPRFDMHQAVADIMGVSRYDGKTINLAISYGMSLNSLAQALGVSREAARLFRHSYNKNSPFLSRLAEKCKETMRTKGRVKTLSGRLLRNEPGFEYKAINKLIQGSAAEQTIEAMILAYERGLPVLFPVHDELCMSSSNPQDAHDLQALMVKAVELEVPTVVDIKSGSSWGDCK